MTKPQNSNPRKSSFNLQIRSKLRKKRHILIKHISEQQVFPDKSQILRTLKSQIRVKWGLFGFACLEKRLDVVYFSNAPTNYAIITTERDLVPMLRTTLKSENFQVLSVHGSIRKAKEMGVARLKVDEQRSEDNVAIQQQILALLETHA